MANNVIVVLKSSQASLLGGEVTITGYEKQIRLQKFPDLKMVNPFRPTRAGNRILTNPQIAPITIITPIGTAAPNSFQAMCNGNNLGTVTITELISDGKNAQVLRQVVLTNVYIISWRLQGDRDGRLCSFTMTFDSLKQTRASVGQDQKAKGKTATTVKKGKQAAS